MSTEAAAGSEVFLNMSLGDFGFQSCRRNWQSPFFTGLAALAAAVVLGFLAVFLAGVIWQGGELFSWRFLTSNPGRDWFDADRAGVLPMLAGTAARVMLMAVFVMPAGVATAVYLAEYAPAQSPVTIGIRSAVHSLAGVPSVVIGLFGLAFFVHFVGGNLDRVFRPGDAASFWGHPALLWASLTLAVMTLPVVVAAVEESLRWRADGLREASMALGATRLQTVVRVVLPQALPGILTGGMLAVSRAAGSVAPILFTGVAHSAAVDSIRLNGCFMDLGYYVFVLSTQASESERTRSILCAAVLALLLLTFTLNAGAVFIRARMRKRAGMFY